MCESERRPDRGKSAVKMKYGPLAVALYTFLSPPRIILQVTLKRPHQTKLHHPNQINLHPDFHTSDLVKTD